MKISRAIGIQTLAICTGLLLLAAATAFSWNRIDSAHQNKGKDSLILLDFRLLQESVKAWLLNNDLIYGSGQTFLVHGTKQQALQCIELAQNIRQSPLGEPFTKTVDSILNQLDGNQKNLDAFQGLSLEQNRPLFEHSVAQWDATSPKMVQYLELLGAQLKAAATENSALIEKQRQNFILIALLAFLGLGLIVFALWRWLSHLIVKPLRVLVNSADFALKNNQHFEVKNSKIFEIETLGKSLNAFVLNLEQRVQQRTQQLEEKQQQLLDEVKLRKAAEKKALKSAAMANASNAAKSEFLANMSHEIRTPLNGIIGSTELLLNDCPNESTVKWLHTIQTSGNHLLELINVVLDFSKIEARQLELTVKTFSLYDLLRNCRAIAQTKSDGSNLALVFKIDPLTPSELHGDRLRICQILTNLLNNAFKFTETGTVTLRLHHELEDDNHINLYWEIEDTGIGISKDALAKVFTPFVQLESGTTRRFAGTGLGLAISQQLAHMMGGGVLDSKAQRVRAVYSVVKCGSNTKKTRNIKIPAYSLERHLFYPKILI
ncbi:MAG: hypothetical protein KBT88_16040 [Gammaproteobacteria bacterium]|nr:hypothetical protein [Gammaproteobacteria bacterium]MBQ0841293.1 hypothetical protein [Gammaproteobacteria bacterium]